MTAAPVATPLGTDEAQLLATELNRCFETLDVPQELFTPDAFFDLLPPFWRFQLQGPAAFANQLRAIAQGPVTSRIIRVVPTGEGFLMEHEESEHRPALRDGAADLGVPGRGRPHRRGHLLLQRGLGRRAAHPPRGRSPDAAAVRTRMSTTVDPALSPSAVIDGARVSPPASRDRAREIEAARRLPPDLLHDLVAAGCFRILLPRPTVVSAPRCRKRLRPLRGLATGDASTGWTVMIGATGWVDLVGLPRATFDALFPPAADVIIAGAFAPSGSISPIDGAYRAHRPLELRQRVRARHVSLRQRRRGLRRWPSAHAGVGA